MIYFKNKGPENIAQLVYRSRSEWSKLPLLEHNTTILDVTPHNYFKCSYPHFVYTIVSRYIKLGGITSIDWDMGCAIF